MRVQNGSSCLEIASCYGQSETVRYLFEVGGKELLMLNANVSGHAIRHEGAP